MRRAILPLLTAALALALLASPHAAWAYDPPPGQNLPPVANAGPDMTLTTTGVWVPLYGYRSYNPDGGAWSWMTYYWSAVQLPPGCGASCQPASPGSVNTQFFVAAYGTYEFQLRVCDMRSACDTDRVTYAFVNLPPVADAGTAISAVVGDLVTLDGSGSYDPNGDTLAYTWNLVSKPEGSQAVLYDTGTVSPNFMPDTPGTYVATLVVFDGYMTSNLASVQVEVVSVLSAASSIIMQAVDIVNGLGEGDVKNLKLQKAYANKVNALLHKVEEGDYLDAMIKLQDDLQAKADGCRDSSPPMPDNNDWILSCDAQAQLTELGMQLYDFLEARLP